MNLENMGVVFWIALVCSCHLLLRTASTLQYDLPSSGSCRPFPDKIWMGCVPKANAEAGKYVNVGTVPLNSCIEECCEDSNCNVIFMYNSTCFKIECESDDACEPVPKEEEKFAHLARMVVVRPVKRSFQWEDQPDVNNDGDDLAMAANEGVSETACDDSVGSGCGLNEACIGNVCVCEEGFERDLNRKCARGTASSNLNSASKAATFSSAKMEQDSSTDSPLKKIIVTVVPKIIRLPDNEVTLSAFTVPAETQGSKNRYSYKWKLLSPKEGGETISETQGATLKLSHLTEGLYTFKVTVSATGEFGETEANVTVLPQKRENEPPIASILPAHQVVKLPNSLAVLDASSSRDDSEIVKYHWELQQGPLGYQPNLSDIQTLQLKDLHQPGNYTFRLTVTDSDGSTNSTLANITVLQVPDYPPEANAGSSIVLFLPKNNVTLNGSLSSDDKGIVSWEWTKSISDQDKAVDMQNTHTPFLQLSHLEEGMYTFVLKVTDNSGQSSSSDVHVFVKPPTNKPPVANAGSNVSIALPQTWVVLNGSFSADDIGIEHWKWEQLSGPQKSTFNPWNASVTNVTGLTKGEYVFQLTVVDGNENTASAIVGVTVTQNKNIPPKANAGGDKTLSLPLGVLILNGSQSYDDLRISKWQWTREPMSLAMGTMLDQSNTSPVLMVTNVVAGRYEFRLRVTDDQGEWDEDTVSIIIKPDPELLNLVELTLNIEAGRLTQSQRDSALLKLGLLLRDASQLVVRNLKSDMNGRAMLVFYVTGPGGSVFGPQVVRTLKDKLAQDSFLLQLSVVDIRTSVCQNNCSGHGVCDQETRVCFCEAFWMQDLFIKYMGDGESNCGWSILYVGIALLSLAFVIVSGIWGLVCLCSRLCHGGSSSPKDNTRYALLESTEQVRRALPLFVSGEVCTGFGRGSKELGMPTANYSSEVVRSLPSNLPNGVYCGWAQVESEPVRMMVMSVGWNPFYQNTEKTMEIHILHDFDSQFYGSMMRVCVVMNMRDELNFSSVDELISTIKDDIAFATKELSNPELAKYKDSDYFVVSST